MPEKTYAMPGSRRLRLIQAGILLTGLSVFAQLYLFQPLLRGLGEHFNLDVATASLSVSLSTAGMALGLFLYLFWADGLSRRRVISFSMVVSALCTLSAALCVERFPGLLAVSLLKGLALSGVSAVALSYLNEEVYPGTIGLTISMYLSGNTIGGMGGRVVSTLVAGWWGWPWAVLTVGGVTLVLGVAFCFLFPRSKNFSPSHLPIRIRLARLRTYLRAPYFVSLYWVAFIGMGVFVSIYNYVGHRLAAPEYGVPHWAIALIYLLYTVGIAGSLYFGRLSDRHPSAPLLRLATWLYLPGLALMMVHSLWVLCLGLCLMTLSFFAMHTLASRLVSTRAGLGRSSAVCLYWLFYYVGSSIFGYATGLVYHRFGWHAFLGVNMLALLVALWLTYRYLRPPFIPDEKFRVPS